MYVSLSNSRVVEGRGEGVDGWFESVMEHHDNGELHESFLILAKLSLVEDNWFITFTLSFLQNHPPFCFYPLKKVAGFFCVAYLLLCIINVCIWMNNAVKIYLTIKFTLQRRRQKQIERKKSSRVWARKWWQFVS